MTRFHGDVLVDGLVDHAVNVGRVRPRDLARVLARAVDDRRYPDDTAARVALGERHGVPPECVLSLNGACEGLWLLAMALRPARGTVYDPTFSEGEAALAASGATIENVALETPEFALTKRPSTGFVIVTNPNNPTGRLESRSRVGSLVAPGRLLIVDESFIDYADGRESMLVDATTDGVIVIRSYTKILSLAGVRVGFLVAAAPLVARLRAARQPWPVNAIALAALEWAARSPGALASLVAASRAEREDLARRLAAVDGVRVAPSVTNFVLVRSPRPGLWRDLRARGYAVRPPSGFRGLDDNYFRAAARAEEENAHLAVTVADLLGGAGD